MKNFIVSVLLGAFMATSIAAEPTVNTTCPPTSVSDIRMGTVGNDIWTYWWCRNSTDVWAIWNTWLEPEWKSHVNFAANNFAVAPNKKFLIRADWSTPVPLDSSGVPTGRQHLWAATKAAIDADSNKPTPGTPNAVPTALPELWVVTPNGASFLRKTSKVVNGIVQSYGTGTQTVRIGTVCDHTKPSFAIGSTTKYLPLFDGPQDEVISCIKIQ